MSNAVVLNELNRQMRMEQVRDGFQDQRDKAFKYVNNRRHRGSGAKGAQRKTQDYSGVAADAYRDWVDGMLGWGVNESSQWQRAAIIDRRFRDSDPVQRYLDEFAEQMTFEMQAGNFYEAHPEQLQDGGSCGTAVMLTEESRDLNHCVHRVPHPDDYWIAENEDHVVDTYHERITMTARQALLRFGRPGDTLHKEVKKWAEDGKGSLWECDFLTCICPATEPAIFSNGRMTPKKFAAVTILYAMHAGDGTNTEAILSQAPGDRLVRVEGFDYFPPTVWRFRRNSDEVYGFSPAMDVMSVIEAAQQHAFNLMNMGNFAAKPMIAIPSEGLDEFSYMPGAKNSYGSEHRLAQTIPIAGEYPVAADREEKIHELIRKRYGYYVWNAVLAFQQKKERVQATEVIEVRADQARLLTGQFNNYWRGGIRPTWDNVAYIAARAGRMPAPPNELMEMRGKDIIIPVFVGPLATVQIQAMKLSGVRQGLGMLSEVGQIVGQHIGPEEAAKLYARIRLPDLAEYICDHSGFPQKLMNDDETTEAIIAAREQRAAAAEEAKIARELAAASGQLGKEPGEHSLLMSAA